MALVRGDTEIEVEGRGREPVGDIVGPLDGEAVGWREKILEHQRIELRTAFEAVGVEMDKIAGERALAAVDGEDREGRARDVFSDAEGAGETLDEGGFADAEIAVKRERGVGREGGGELGGERLGLGGG